MPPLSHPRKVLLLALATTVPATTLALFLLWRGEFSARVQWTATIALLLALLIGLSALHERVVRPLQTLSNMLAALREGDYSLRARGANAWDDSLGLVFLEANTLAETLRGQRLGALEATAILRTVLAEIDAAIFAFDSDGTLRLRSGCWDGPPPSWRWRTASRGRRRGWSTGPAGTRGATSCGGTASGRTAGRISWWCSPT